MFFISFPLLFWPQSRAFSCQMQQETVGLFDVSSDIILPVPFFHYHDERRRLRNFVDANTTWILAMAKCCDLLKFLYLCWCSYNITHPTSCKSRVWMGFCIPQNEYFCKPILWNAVFLEEFQWESIGRCCGLSLSNDGFYTCKLFVSDA